MSKDTKNYEVHDDDTKAVIGGIFESGRVENRVGSYIVGLISQFSNRPEAESAITEIANEETRMRESSEVFDFQMFKESANLILKKYKLL